MRLALIEDLKFLNISEAKKFAKDLDIYVGTSNKAEIISLLTTSYLEGRELLKANDSKILKQLREEVLSSLVNKNKVEKLSTSSLKSYAKQLGLYEESMKGRRSLISALETYVKNATGRSLFKFTSEVLTKSNFTSASSIESKSSNIGKLAQNISENVQSEQGIEKSSKEKNKALEMDLSSTIVPSNSQEKKHVKKQSSNKQGSHKKGLTEVVLTNPTIDLKAAEEDEIKSHYYYATEVNIGGYGVKRTKFNSGGGDCFFLAIQQGLRWLKMIPFDEDEMRQNLSFWFQEDSNAAAQWMLHRASPSDLIPVLPEVGGIEPLEGWSEYLKGRDWKFWGKRIAKKGVWVGAIELEAMNDLLLNAGYNVRVNIWDSKTEHLFGADRNIPEQKVLILYLEAGHFEILLPITSAH